VVRRSRVSAVPPIARPSRGARALAVASPKTPTVLAVVLSLALAGCGATRVPLVASVQGSSISRGELAHWMRIKRSELTTPSTPASSLSAVEVKRKALAFLITARWLQREAAAKGIGVSPSEVNATYQRLLNAPTGKSFAASLQRRGMSRADELLVLRLDALAQKLRAKIASTHHSTTAAQTQRQISAFLAAYRQRWKQRTTCEPGYVIAECRNGPPLPALPASPAG
jgi:SurA-like N-terminal domain